VALAVAGLFLAIMSGAGSGGTTESGKARSSCHEHSFWWYCNNIVASVLVGIALFEVFHDVQYYH